MLIYLILKFILVIFYILTLSLAGKNLLRTFKVEVFHNSISDLIVGFIFMEILSFISWLIGTGLLKLNYWTHFIPVLILVIWQLFVLTTGKGNKIASSQNFKRYYPVLILTAIISFILLFEAFNQFVTAITNNGVLHVDIVYHSGITNSILKYGYPVLDLQFEGGLVRYHIFTHFIASQFSFITGVEPYKIFTLFFPFFSIFCISILIFYILKDQLSSDFLVIKYLITGIIAFLGAYVFPT